MAKVKLNPALEQFRGQVGDLVFKRYGDEAVITRKPDMSNIVPSLVHLVRRGRFWQATVYGKLVLARSRCERILRAGCGHQRNPRALADSG